MTTDWKALCAELLAWAEKTSSPYYKHAVLLRARAALADEPAVPEGREPASVVEQPTRRQLMMLADEMGMASIGDAALYARAVLTRWGNPAPQPTAEGKEEQVWPPSVADGCHRGALSAALGSPEQRLLVAAGNTIENLWQKLHRTVSVQAAPVLAEAEELVEGLKDLIYDVSPSNADMLTRAADLLQHLSPPQPVPVNERWPEFSDCESTDDRVWCWNPFLDHWKLSRIKQGVHTHWLPFHALPLPEQEVSK